MSLIDLEAIRQRADAATPGPWEAAQDVAEYWRVIWRAENLAVFQVGYDGHERVEADAKFAAHARQDVPLLLDEVDRLGGELHRSRTLSEQRVHERDDALALAEGRRIEAERLREAVLAGRAALEATCYAERRDHERIWRTSGDVPRWICRCCNATLAVSEQPFAYSEDDGTQHHSTCPIGRALAEGQHSEPVQGITALLQNGTA